MSISIERENVLFLMASATADSDDGALVTQNWKSLLLFICECVKGGGIISASIEASSLALASMLELDKFRVTA